MQASAYGPEVAKVGLVLGAGGVAGGAFHAGVLAALQVGLGWDARRADVIVGTSAGAVAATSLRAGLAASDMLARAEGRPLSAEGARLLRSVGPPAHPPLRPAGGARARAPSAVAATLSRAAARPFAARPLALLAGLLPEGTVGTEFIAAGVGALVRDWPAMPLWLCAVRQRDGRLVVFGRDSRPPVADAVAASCAIPGFFRPVEVDGEAYIDGGAHSPTNADVLVRQDLDLVVVSSPMSVAGRGIRFSADQPVRRWARALLDAEALRLRRRRIGVVAFQPTVEDVAVMGLNAMDPDRRAAIAAQARASTLRRLERPDTSARLAALVS